MSFASPKSSTFTVPSGRSLTLAGFRSRWMIPCSCAASSASAICLAIGKRLVERNRTLRNPVGERRPFDQFEHERADAVRFFQAVDRADVRMIQRREDLGFPLKARQAIGIVRRRAPAGSSARRRDRASCRGRDTPRPSRRRRAAK